MRDRDPYRWGWSRPDVDDDDDYLEKITTRGVTKSNPTQKCRPAKGISKRVNIQITKDTDLKVFQHAGGGGQGLTHNRA
jgi:hypothetical protein